MNYDETGSFRNQKPDFIAEDDTRNRAIDGSAQISDHNVR